MRHAVVARITGGVDLVYFVTSIARGLLAPGVTGPRALDAALLHGPIYQMAVALRVVSTGLYFAVVGLLYRAFASVFRRVGVLVLLFGLTGCVLMAVGSACKLAASSVAADVAVVLCACPASSGF